MSLLSYNRLVELVKQGVINAPLENINGASIDITLDNTILVESPKEGLIDLAAKENVKFYEYFITKYTPFDLEPDQFILASSRETFNLPDNIACEYKLKSSLARNGLQHMLAGWCDPAWNNSKLTLEFKNVTQYNTLLLKPGMKIGQMVFFECEPVPSENSYATKGQYNNQSTTTASKGVR